MSPRAEGGTQAAPKPKSDRVPPKSLALARPHPANFERGTGEALVTYENEMRLCRKLGREIPDVLPSATLLIEGPAAVVESSVARHGNRELAGAFLAFLHSADGQRILVEWH